MTAQRLPRCTRKLRARMQWQRQSAAREKGALSGEKNFLASIAQSALPAHNERAFSSSSRLRPCTILIRRRRDRPATQATAPSLIPASSVEFRMSRVVVLTGPACLGKTEQLLQRTAELHGARRPVPRSDCAHLPQRGQISSSDCCRRNCQPAFLQAWSRSMALRARRCRRRVRCCGW